MRKRNQNDQNTPVQTGYHLSFLRNKALRPLFRERFEHLRGVPFRLHLRKHALHFAVRADDKRLIPIYFLWPLTRVAALGMTLGAEIHRKADPSLRSG